MSPGPNGRGKKGGGARGGNPPSDILIRACELLEDGEWKYLEEVLKECAKLVPPGKAMRQMERLRQYKGSPNGRQKDLDTHRQIEAGRRSIARAIIAGKPEVFELYPPRRGAQGPSRDTTKLIRLIEMPHSVRRMREGKWFDPKGFVDKLESVDEEEYRGILDTIEWRRDVERVAEELARRLKAARFLLEHGIVDPGAE